MRSLPTSSFFSMSSHRLTHFSFTIKSQWQNASFNHFMSQSWSMSFWCWKSCRKGWVWWLCHRICPWSRIWKIVKRWRKSIIIGCHSRPLSGRWKYSIPPFGPKPSIDKNYQLSFQINFYIMPKLSRIFTMVKINIDTWTGNFRRVLHCSKADFSQKRYDFKAKTPIWWSYCS